MSTAATAPQLSSEFLFKELTKRFAGRPTEIQQRVTAHIRSKTGHSTLPSFFGNGADEATKCLILEECLNAILKNDFTGLQGQVPTGQAAASEPGEDGQKVTIASNPAKFAEQTAEKLGVKDNPRVIVAAVTGSTTPKAKIQTVPARSLDAVKPEEPAGDKVAAAIAALSEALKSNPGASAPSEAADSAKIAELVKAAVAKELAGWETMVKLKVVEAVNQAKWDMVQEFDKAWKKHLETIADVITSK